MLSSRPVPSPIADRLKELGIELPEPSKPGANYVPAVHTRMAIGISALPYDVAVEVEGLFEVH
jgi:hypothetical protein